MSADEKKISGTAIAKEVRAKLKSDVAQFIESTGACSPEFSAFFILSVCSHVSAYYSPPLLRD
jgi:hypothetical protein